MSGFKDSNYIDWLEKEINDKRIKVRKYKYSDFRNKQLIGRGSFACVYRANWKSTNTVVALKTFNSTIPKDVIHEVWHFIKLY
jgi:serine/threonine protein kinase